MIDIVKLRELWSAAQRPHAAQSEVRHEALIALPELLTIAEAALAWRESPCDQLPFCERGDHEHDCTIMRLERELVAAVDAARKAGT